MTSFLIFWDLQTVTSLQFSLNTHHNLEFKLIYLLLKLEETYFHKTN